MNLEDKLLGKLEILQKYPQGSPDYPTHHAGCECSGCYASWVEWRGANSVVEPLREQICELTVRAVNAETRLDKTKDFLGSATTVIESFRPLATAVRDHLDACPPEVRAAFEGIADMVADADAEETRP